MNHSLFCLLLRTGSLPQHLRQLPFRLGMTTAHGFLSVHQDPHFQRLFGGHWRNKGNMTNKVDRKLLLIFRFSMADCVVGIQLEFIIFLRSDTNSVQEDSEASGDRSIRGIFKLQEVLKIVCGNEGKE